ncbi:SMI1/KNR4 family protein [Rhodococcus sp. AG1013]|uniref:SMI1/KNR4 family protein n=2 Tax=Rhodococcus TaxID=1827 RepID=UPI000E0B8311|nr:SMI1/KNR4 family protein [Rhodococcus sp. AG1013]RDI16459.1 hypothetical protein DEU38_12651 [Rhodococcus sp. AG1013]
MRAPDTHIDVDFLDTFRFPDGAGFPDSYRAFVRELGWGRLFGLWLVYPPVRGGYAAAARPGARSSRAKAYRDGQVEEFDWMIEPDGNWALVDSLQVFAISENGDVLLWDTAARDERGEFPVYCSQRMNSLRLLGPSLDAAAPVLRAESATLFGATEVDFEPLAAQRLP